MKTEGPIQERSRSYAKKAWWGVLLASILALVSTSSIRPEIWTNFMEHPWGFVFPLLGAFGLIGMFYYGRKAQDSPAFLSSSTFIAGMLASTAFGLFPNLLPASTGSQFSLTVNNAMAGEYGLGVGIVWWIIGVVLALGYFTYLFISFRGKIRLPVEGEGY